MSLVVLLVILVKHMSTKGCSDSTGLHIRLVFHTR